MNGRESLDPIAHINPEEETTKQAVEQAEKVRLDRAVLALAHSRVYTNQETEELILKENTRKAEGASEEELLGIRRARWPKRIEATREALDRLKREDPREYDLLIQYRSGQGELIEKMGKEKFNLIRGQITTAMKIASDTIGEGIQSGRVTIPNTALIGRAIEIVSRDNREVPREIMGAFLWQIIDATELGQYRNGKGSNIKTGVTVGRQGATQPGRDLQGHDTKARRIEGGSGQGVRVSVSNVSARSVVIHDGRGNQFRAGPVPEGGVPITTKGPIEIGGIRVENVTVAGSFPEDKKK